VDVKTATAAPTNRRKGQPGLANHGEYETKFLISMHINPAVLDALSDAEKAAIGAGHGTFIEALKLWSKAPETAPSACSPAKPRCSTAARISVPMPCPW
jgi:hypothetical protein